MIDAHVTFDEPFCSPNFLHSLYNPMCGANVMISNYIQQ